MTNLQYSEKKIKEHFIWKENNFRGNHTIVIIKFSVDTETKFSVDTTVSGDTHLQDGKLLHRYQVEQNLLLLRQVLKRSVRKVMVKYNNCTLQNIIYDDMNI